MAKAKQNKTGSKSLSEDVDMDMTPMIDCVFLLMIFFVLVIDLSQKDLEDLILPKAEYAVPDEDPPDLRPIINIVQDGSVVYRGNEFYSPEQGDNTTGMRTALETILREEQKKLTIVPKTIAGRTAMLVDDPMLIRADKWTEWHHVGKFMTECSQPMSANFWKLELAMSEEDKEAPLREKAGYK